MYLPATCLIHPFILEFSFIAFHVVLSSHIKTSAKGKFQSENNNKNKKKHNLEHQWLTDCNSVRKKKNTFFQSRPVFFWGVFFFISTKFRRDSLGQKPFRLLFGFCVCVFFLSFYAHIHVPCVYLSCQIDTQKYDRNPGERWKRKRGSTKKENRKLFFDRKMSNWNGRDLIMTIPSWIMMDKNENEAYPVDSRAAFSDNLFFFLLLLFSLIIF